MIGVARVPEPKDFDRRARKPGRAWLATHAGIRPRNLWSAHLPALAKGFSNLCAYAAMYEPTGTVDHYKSLKNRPDLAYEWSNYRFASQTLNASKKNADDAILDPYVVREGWFEILLPSLQMRATSKVPAKWRAAAEYTLMRLRLRDGELAVGWRRNWYAMYEDGKMGLEALRQVAPLIAEAVDRETSKGAPKRPAKRRTR